MINRQQLIVLCLQLILKSKVRPQVIPRNWLTLLIVADYSGFLYVGFEEDKISSVAIAYRVKEVTQYLDKLPDKEEGNILFVPIMVSFDQDKARMRKKIKTFMDANKDVEKIVFESRNGGFKEFKRRGDQWEKTQ